MGVLPSAPAPDIKSSDIHVGFSPESTPTLGQRQSRDSRRLCQLGSKIKINGNGNGKLGPDTAALEMRSCRRRRSRRLVQAECKRRVGGIRAMDGLLATMGHGRPFVAAPGAVLE